MLARAALVIVTPPELATEPIVRLPALPALRVTALVVAVIAPVVTLPPVAEPPLLVASMVAFVATVTLPRVIALPSVRTAPETATLAGLVALPVVATPPRKRNTSLVPSPSVRLPTFWKATLLVISVELPLSARL